MTPLQRYQQDLSRDDFAFDPALDYTASRAIEDIVADAQAKQRKVVVALPNGSVADMLKREHSLDCLPETHLLPDREAALGFAGLLINKSQGE